MTRILICEPNEELRRLLARMVSELGHQPVAVRAPGPEHIRDADLFILEPSDTVALATAQAVRLIDPLLPLIAIAGQAPPPELHDLGVEFAAILPKPFTFEQLAAAIARATSR
ncbi:MAG TPA: hypothetical protein VMG62_02065 [Solirubrobacteraceae bacterium]|nr:hypothetical protein [Solirubrobacteraceae bacterium]